MLLLCIINTLTTGRISGFSCQNNQIARGFAHVTQVPKAVESFSKAKMTWQVF